MSGFCRVVGYFYETDGMGDACIGCGKLLWQGERLRILLQFTEEICANVEAEVWVLWSRYGEEESKRLDSITLRHGVREYCLTYRMCVQNAVPQGLVIMTEEKTLYANFCPERELRIPEAIRQVAEQKAVGGTASPTATEEAGTMGELHRPRTAEDTLAILFGRQEAREEEQARDTGLLALLPLSEKVAGLMQLRPVMKPFLRSPFARCVRISLWDVHLLYGEMGGSDGNSFICHGYYRYRHLLLANVLATTEKPETFYLLVPGMGCPSERRMAKMHGFQEFYGLRRSAWENGSFGYYAMELATAPVVGSVD